MTTTVAIVNAEGEIVQIYSSGQQVEPEGAWGSDGSMTVVHISGSVDNTNTFITQQYYKDGVWKERSARPNVYYNWKDEAWVLDSVRLWEEVRKERNIKLAMCDWTQAADSPLTDSKKEEWIIYRQRLRDTPVLNLPSSEITHLDQIVWPTQPTI